ncbi:unnamed protein product [Bemisia tabaci]|uniref:Uncharacterized protein n=1 Tax=Bemisia tabaci TaxID=7038 RepID=A0A9P0FAX3_BEMTA|nr:unnamed protein product [Bemisia tabaci]
MNDKKQRTDSLDGGGQYPDVGMSGIAVNVQCETTLPNSIAEVGPTVFLKQNLSEVNFTTGISHDKCSDPGPPTVKKENMSPSCDDFTSSEQLYSFESTVDPLVQVKRENEDPEDEYLFHTYIECKSEAPDHLSVA